MTLSPQIADFALKSGWCEDDSYKVVTMQSTINGYHAHRVLPLTGTEMPLICARERGNRYSRNAVLVTTPHVAELSQTAKRGETRLNGRTVPASEVCGKSCGRMPMALSDVLGPAMDNGKVDMVKSFYLGEMEHAGPERGGGPKLKCIYLIKARQEVIDKLTGYTRIH